MATTRKLMRTRSLMTAERTPHQQHTQSVKHSAPPAQLGIRLTLERARASGQPQSNAIKCQSSKRQLSSTLGKFHNYGFLCPHHHCIRSSKALSATAIFDFDWSDSPRDWADRASTFIPPSAPEPVKFQRKRLDLKFAVLLMRSSYEAVDELDFIPMDKFQIKFWKLRQSELEPYALLYSPLKAKYGDLGDPLYFDFISFSQYATISNEMREGQQVFQEKLGAGGLVKTVRRNPELRDNASLPSAFRDIVAQKIYNGLLNGFEEVQFGGPAPCEAGASSDCIVRGVRTLVSIFVKAGYALKATVSDASGPRDGRLKLEVRVEGPANLWSVRSLASRRASVYNEFLAFAVLGFLQASGFSATSASKYSDTGIDYEFECTPRT